MHVASLQSEDGSVSWIFISSTQGLLFGAIIPNVSFGEQQQHGGRAHANVFGFHLECVIALLDLFQERR